MELSEYCANERGRQRVIAEKIGVSSAYMNQMVTGHRPIPVEYCARIEQATEGMVSRQEMRPSDWHEIWPELLEASDD